MENLLNPDEIIGQTTIDSKYTARKTFRGRINTGVFH